MVAENAMAAPYCLGVGVCEGGGPPPEVRRCRGRGHLVAWYAVARSVDSGSTSLDVDRAGLSRKGLKMAVHRPGLPVLTDAPFRVVVRILFRGSVPRVSPVSRGVGRLVFSYGRVSHYGSAFRHHVKILCMRHTLVTE